ncbi:MAG: hypothetical protein ABIH03_16430 [Pseudomonadota bacterium]
MKLRLLAIVFLAFSLFVSPQPWAQEKTEAPPTGQPPQVQPKFIWGVVISFIWSELASLAFGCFKDWLGEKMKSGLDKGIEAGTAKLLSKSSGARIVEAKSSGILAKDGVNTTTRAPTTPLSVEDGKENYQAAQISVGVADRDGKLTFRPINQGFHGGERIKLHVIATFNGLMMIENINPKQERKQIYPAERTKMVEIQAGKETLIPLGEDQYFEFTKTTGEEQLVITLRDPRAEDAAKSTAKVNRKDERYGSQFVQEVKPNTYPSLTEAIKLVHF